VNTRSPLPAAQLEGGIDAVGVGGGLLPDAPGLAREYRECPRAALMPVAADAWGIALGAA